MAEIQVEEENFEELLEESFKKRSKKKFITGEVFKITPQEVYVDINGKYSGVCSASEFLDKSDTTKRIEDVVKIGDKFDFVFNRTDDGAALTYLSIAKTFDNEVWDELQKFKEDKIPLSGLVKKILKVGILVKYEQVLVFIPASQIDSTYVSDFSKLINTTVEYIIIEVDKDKRKIVGSMKALKDAKRKDDIEKFFENTKPGDKVQGTVKSITNYGAFLDLGAVDGLLHISEMSWKKIVNPNEILKLGEKISLFVKQIKPETKKVLLTLKSMDEHPYFSVAKKFPVGTVFEGKVVKICPFGVFVEITDEMDSLMHKSFFEGKNWPKVGDILKCVVVGLDNDKKHIIIKPAD